MTEPKTAEELASYYTNRHPTGGALVAACREIAALREENEDLRHNLDVRNGVIAELQKDKEHLQQQVARTWAERDEALEKLARAIPILELVYNHYEDREVSTADPTSSLGRWRDGMAILRDAQEDGDGE